MLLSSLLFNPMQSSFPKLAVSAPPTPFSPPPPASAMTLCFLLASGRAHRLTVKAYLTSVYHCMFLEPFPGSDSVSGYYLLHPIEGETEAQ